MSDRANVWGRFLGRLYCILQELVAAGVEGHNRLEQHRSITRVACSRCRTIVGRRDHMEGEAEAAAAAARSARKAKAAARKDAKAEWKEARDRELALLLTG